MITLERARLINWHNFLDNVIEIGNRCLLAGDNGSSKSTIIDAIQYVMAANLRMAKFNSAAEERKSGSRDLMGYVRRKLGAEMTEYRRENTISHVMLQWTQTGSENFICGVCIEAYSDNRYMEHFWIGGTDNIRETSELPEYREKIAKAYQDTEKEFKEHFISHLNEHIEEARQSFDEISEILRTLHFGRDQYRFHLEELNERKGQIEVIRNAAKIPFADSGMYNDSLFSQIEDPDEKEAARNLFDRILNAPLDSEELRSICDYRTYFHYDIIITETDHFDDKGLPVKLSLSRVLKEKSGGESQTPYYVAIAASFYRFYKNRPDNTVRLVIFDEAFNRMDDERIGKILLFYNNLNLQIITSVPPEKIEAIAPFMDRINIVSRSGGAVKVRDCHKDYVSASELDLNMET